MKTFKKKAGLPPGSLVFTGKQHAEEVMIDIIDYGPDSFKELKSENIEECFPYRDTAGVTWIDIKGVHDSGLVSKLGEYFEIHPLVLEDILHTNQRPKMEVFDNYLFIVLRMLSYNEEENIIDSEQVSMIIGRGYVISLQEKEEDVLDPLRERLRKGKGRIRKVGADYLAYAILDVIADNYFLLLEKLGEQMEDFEDRLLNGPDQETLKQLYILKRETVLLRKSVWPMREVVTQLERADSPLIMDQTVPFLRDLHDHTIRIIETVETHREMTAGLIELYLSSNSNKMNEVMKVLTIIATIFIPLTFIAGVYGMNFANMPELEWPWAYFAVLLIMFTIGAGMIFYFRRKKWL